MATDNPVISYNGDFTEITYFYEGLDNGDDGTVIRLPGGRAKTKVEVQVIGTFGSGGSISFEGSNVASPGTTDANYFVMTDVHGNAATYTSAGGDAIAESPKFVRPHVTAGDGSTDLDATIVITKPRPSRT